MFYVSQRLHMPSCQEDKGHALDVAFLSEETSLKKHSGIARVVKGLHSFTCIPMHLSRNGMNHARLCFPI